MDLELSADQMSLRDGIASLLDAKFPIDRVRNGFDRAMFDELAAAGVFTLRRDGFAWADCAVVFEQLGRYCVPGPLVPSLLLGDGRVAGLVGVTEPQWIEHLDELDVVVVDDNPLGLVDARDVDADASPWPLDPLTPVARITKLPASETIAAEHSEWQVAGATLTAALAGGPGRSA